MNCEFCGYPLQQGMQQCPACGGRCTGNTASSNEPLNAEQLAFYAEQEGKCRKEMNAAKNWMIAIPIICLVPGFIIMCLGGAWVFFLFGGIGIIGVIAQAIVYSANAKKLEKLQREKLFRER